MNINEKYELDELDIELIEGIPGLKDNFFRGLLKVGTFNGALSTVIVASILEILRETKETNKLLRQMLPEEVKQQIREQANEKRKEDKVENSVDYTGNKIKNLDVFQMRKYVKDNDLEVRNYNKISANNIMKQLKDMGIDVETVL